MKDTELKNIVDKFPEFIKCLKDKENKCILIAKFHKFINKKNCYFYYLSISGTDDTPEFKKNYHIGINICNEIKHIFKNLYKENIPSIEYVYMKDNVLFKEVLAKEGYGKTFDFVSYKDAKQNSNFNHRHYSCVERKLLAFFENDLIKMDECDYIICRYEPCKYCYWVAQSLTNFYVFGDGKAYRIFIPENLKLIKNDLTDEQKLLLILDGNGHNYNYNTMSFSANYLFIKEPLS